MTGLTRVAVMAAICCALTTSICAAESPGNAANDSDIAALEAIYSAQQNRLVELERQVANVGGRNQDAARIEAMKQQIREVLSESEFRESLMPSVMQAGYDKGFYIKSSDDKFSLKIGWIFQFRWTYYNTGDNNRYLNPRLQRDDRSGFDINRGRLRIGGHAWDPNLTYFFSMTHGTDTRYDVRSIYAWLNYKFRDEFQVTVGQMRLASTRAQVSPITRYQLVELPFTDAVFGCGCGIGVRLWGRLFDKRVTYQLDVVNSLGGVGNRTITTDPSELDSNPAIIFRAVWHALGDNPGKEFRNQSDLDFHESPALDIGFQYNFNDDAGDLRSTRIPFSVTRPGFGQGGFGLVNSNGLQFHTFGYEAAFQYRGFSAISECHLRLVDPRRAGRRPFAPLWLMTREGGDSTYYGGYLQAGYFLPIPGYERKFEVAARVEGLGGVDPGNQGTWMYTIGVNYFIEGDRIKLQADVSRVEEAPVSSGVYSLANVNDSPVIARVQLSFAF